MGKGEHEELPFPFKLGNNFLPGSIWVENSTTP